MGPGRRAARSAAVNLTCGKLPQRASTCGSLRKMQSLLARIGLHRPELRAWALYDWANSVFMTTVLQVFPIYFTSVVAADLPPALASERFAWATTMAMLIVAVVSPALGAVADQGGARKKMMAASVALGVAATAALYFVGDR